MPHLAPVRDALAAAGATLRHRTVQHDVLYDFPDRRLTARDTALRLRRSDRGATLTYKGPAEAATFKLRVEHESGVDDADAVAAALDALGMEVTLSYRKRRDTWELDGCAVCLDAVPGLGTFVEVEGPEAATIAGVIRRLGLDPANHVTESYPSMLAAQCAHAGTDPARLHEQPLADV